MKIPIILIWFLLFPVMTGCANSRDYQNEKDLPSHHTKEGFRNPHLSEEKLYILSS